MPHAGAGRTPKSVGLWGAPSSGKTTFLASLFIAVNRRPAADLNIVGANTESTNFLIDSTRTLTRDHRFPAATMQAAAYSWTMNVTTTVQRTDGGRFGRKTTVTEDVSSQFNIDLRDAPGGYFGNTPQPAQQAQQPQGRLNLAGGGGAGGGGGGGAPAAGGTSTVSPEDEMMDYLSGCDGLLLLIDPVREQKLGDAHDYFQTTLLKVAQRKLATPGAPPRLPHHVAVCITKFDHPDVYGFARLRSFRTYDENDEYLFPRVHNDDAEMFFKEFCRSSPNSEADMLCSGLQRYFHPSRVRFFVTSAIGFYIGQSSRFLDSDPQNAEEINGTPAIRGRIYPINVLEPIMWLGQRVLAGS
jgi:hypothetical protein